MNSIEFSEKIEDSWKKSNLLFELTDLFQFIVKILKYKVW